MKTLLVILFFIFSKNIISEELPNYYCQDETGLLDIKICEAEYHKYF